MRRVLVFLLLMALIFVFGSCANVTKKITAYITCPDGNVKIVDVKSYTLYSHTCTIIRDFDGHKYLVSPANLIIDEEVVK